MQQSKLGNMKKQVDPKQRLNLMNNKSVTAARPEIKAARKNSPEPPSGYEAHKPSLHRIKSTKRPTGEPSLWGGIARSFNENGPFINGNSPSPNLAGATGNVRAVGIAGSRGTEGVGGAVSVVPAKSQFADGDNANHKTTVEKLDVPMFDVADIDPRLLSTRALTGGTADGGAGQCTPQDHVAFVKVHKAASSTVANILQRYGFTRQLNFVLPNKPMQSSGYNYINKPGEPLTASSLLPPPPGQRYDILWNHAIYDRRVFDIFMPSDTVYVTILREPFQQFVSSYAFYNAIRANASRLLRVNPFSNFLHNMTHSRLLDYFRNKQSQDLGMSAQHVVNDALRHQYLNRLSKELNLVMITEFFDESLVLLRRLMCWSVKDVLYIPKNKNVHKPSFVFSSQDYAKHRQLSSLDYELYEYFRRKFLRTMAAHGVDFEQEVNHFKDVLQHVQKFCRESEVNSLDEFFVPRSPWSEQFVVTRQDCQLLLMPELRFLDMLLNARFAYGDLLPDSDLAQN